MSLLPPTRALLVFLNRHPDVRAQIAALPDATLLYAGRLMQPAWKEIEAWREQLPQLKTKKTLPDVLQTIRLTGQPHPNLLAWAQSLDQLLPWKDNGFIGWRALSGIFASNAKGSVSFVVGSGVTRDEKVFAATEVSVLLRNPQVDEITRDLLAYYQRCLQAGRSDLCVSYVSA
jgi:hypothetical protein